MLKKKYALILLSLLICMIAISSVSAAEDAATDDIIGDDVASETIAIDSQEEVIGEDTNDETVVDSGNQEILASDEDEEVLANAEDDEVLASSSPNHNQYSVEFTSKNYKINWYDGGTISLDITPTDTSYYYDFYFYVYDSYGIINSDNIYSGNEDDYKKYLSNPYKYKIDKESETLVPGTYTLKLVNYLPSDQYEFDTATLTVVDEQVSGKITITESGTYYNAKTITVQVTDDDNNPIGGAKVLLSFSNDKTAVVTTASNGKANYKVPFNAGNYIVKASPYSQALTANVKSLSFKIAQDPGLIKITQSGKYASNKKLTFKVTDKRTGFVVKNQKVTLKFSNGKSTFVRTNSKGIATYNMKFNPGTYTVIASATNANIKFVNTKLGNIRIYKTPVVLNPRPLVAYYASGKYFNVKVVDNTKKAIGGVKLKLDIYTGSRKQTRYIKTVSTGWAKFGASTLAVGTHKVIVSVASTNLHVGKAQASRITIRKGVVNIYAPNVVNAYKQDGKYGVRIYNRDSGNPLSGWTVQIKVYTGSSAKTFKVKTNANGYASIPTNTFSKGPHNVVVNTVANSYYNAAKATGSLSIANKIPTHFDIDRSSLRYTTITTYAGGVPYATYILSVHVPVRLLDNLGHEIYKTVTLRNDDNTETGTSGETISIGGGSDITLRFAGDSKYMPCTYVLDI